VVDPAGAAGRPAALRLRPPHRRAEVDLAPRRPRPAGGGRAVAPAGGVAGLPRLSGRHRRPPAPQRLRRPVRRPQRRSRPAGAGDGTHGRPGRRRRAVARWMPAPGSLQRLPGDELPPVDPPGPGAGARHGPGAAGHGGLVAESRAAHRTGQGDRLSRGVPDGGRVGAARSRRPGPRRPSAARPWTFSTYQAAHDATAVDLPGIVFLAERPPPSGSPVRRPVIDVEHGGPAVRPVHRALGSRRRVHGRGLNRARSGVRRGHPDDLAVGEVTAALEKDVRVIRCWSTARSAPRRADPPAILARWPGATPSASTTGPSAATSARCRTSSSAPGASGSGTGQHVRARRETGPGGTPSRGGIARSGRDDSPTPAGAARRGRGRHGVHRHPHERIHHHPTGDGNDVAITGDGARTYATTAAGPVVIDDLQIATTVPSAPWCTPSPTRARCRRSTRPPTRSPASCRGAVQIGGATNPRSTSTETLPQQCHPIALSPDG
jgi:hypothetical protein